MTSSSSPACFFFVAATTGAMTAPLACPFAFMGVAALPLSRFLDRFVGVPVRSALLVYSELCSRRRGVACLWRAIVIEGAGSVVADRGQVGGKVEGCGRVQWEVPGRRGVVGIFISTHATLR